jgi:hypothetical protein
LKAIPIVLVAYITMDYGTRDINARYSSVDSITSIVNPQDGKQQQLKGCNFKPQTTLRQFKIDG